MLKMNKVKILYSIIVIMGLTIIVMSDLISVNIIDNSLIFSLNIEPPLMTIEK